MKVSYNWLKDYVNFDLTPQQLGEKLTMVGFEVEEIIDTLPKFENIVVGKVLSSKKHPNADKLSICKVQLPADTFDVICGAPNVKENQKIAFAKIGVVLPGGLKIKKAKIRGIDSYGMICSQEELGLADKSSGIWELPESWEIGDDVYQNIADTRDYIFDLAITPNRPDAMSMIGIAREVAAFSNSNLKIPDVQLNTVSEYAKDHVEIDIQTPVGNPRYTAKIIKDIKVGPSPDWICERLLKAGIRPINNIVDITNYVLIETGQPLHAFDYHLIEGKKIIVRNSKENETFKTLDEKERVLPKNTVLICDAQKTVAIGGIMGGLNSEVTDNTDTVLLESAYFNPLFISRSSKRMGLSTEASQRFERGMDPNSVIYAAERAAQLMSEIAGGKILAGTVDSYPKEVKPKKFRARVDRINKVLGTTLLEKDIKKILSSLEISYNNQEVTIPTFRPDLEREADIVEEIARCITFDEIPLKEKTSIYYEHDLNVKDEYLNNLKIQLSALNLSEAITNSMISKEIISEKDDEKSIMAIYNPISDDMNIMRPSLFPGLLRSAAYNFNRNQSNIRLFELGRIFKKLNDKYESEQPYILSGVISGDQHLPNWSVKSKKVDFYDIKGFVELFLNKIYLDKAEFILYDSHNYLEKNETLAVKSDGQIIGYFGKIVPELLDKIDIESEVYGFEFYADSLFEIRNKNRKYKSHSKFPYIEKDVAFVFDWKLNSHEIIKEIKKIGGNLVVSVDIFDVFTGESIGSENKSIAFRIRFQSNERTLKDGEAQVIFEKIIQKIEKKYNAKLRQ